MNLLVGALLIAVMECVDDAFPHTHADAVAHLFVKPGSFRHAEAHLLRQVHAFDLRIKDNFHVLVVLRHVFVGHRKNCVYFDVVWVTHCAASRQWRERITPEATHLWRYSTSRYAQYDRTTVRC